MNILCLALLFVTAFASVIKEQKSEEVNKRATGLNCDRACQEEELLRKKLIETWNTRDTKRFANLECDRDCQEEKVLRQRLINSWSLRSLTKNNDGFDPMKRSSGGLKCDRNCQEEQLLRQKLMLSLNLRSIQESISFCRNNCSS